ncbi:FAD-dependent oxidoreductase [Allosalinactinospora lopnorensis]|uniref:FAD-dependent oxidoreductase n=1 Tax=Allosalinactinospora lopnorensis TaxID=1352348 RepID=UPI000623F90C|nr:FAD-dependent oxidoreductase [Allosalinactinospora lopnorensis]
MNDDLAPGTRVPVAIIGAGPVGLSLALGLARQGVRAVLVEQDGGTSDRSKAPTIHTRTREIFRGWGVERPMVDEGELVGDLRVRSADSGNETLFSLDFSELDDEADRPGILFLEQGRIERLLLRAVRESGLCDIRFGTELVGMDIAEDGVKLTVRRAIGEYSFEAGFVVGCDGANGFVRGALRLPFEGITYPVRPVLADVRVADERNALPWPRLHNGRGGLASAIRLRPGLWRIVRLAGNPGQSEVVPDDEVRELAADVLGPGPVEVVWAGRFRVHRRWSPHFRVGNVLLAGDAAHVHPPLGGHGMNVGIQDAANLAWKLAQALSGGDVERLLESYDVERREIVGTVSRWATVNSLLFLQAPLIVRTGMLRFVPAMFAVPHLRRLNLRRVAMLDLTCPASPLMDHEERAAGMRLPNPLLRSAEGADVRLYDLLPNGAALIEVGRGAGADVSEGDLPVDKVVRIGPGGYFDPTGLLRGLLREQEGWILVRPDGHIAWARHRSKGMGEAARHALGMKS